MIEDRPAPNRLPDNTVIGSMTPNVGSAPFRCSACGALWPSRGTRCPRCGGTTPTAPPLMSIKGQAAVRATRAAARLPEGHAAVESEGTTSTEPATAIAAGHAHGIAAAGLTSPAPAYPIAEKAPATRDGVTWGDVGDVVAKYAVVLVVFCGLWALLIYLLIRSAG